MKLREYVQQVAKRGACLCGKCIDAPENPEQHQPKGHTADVIFFKVSAEAIADAERFRELVKAEFPHWLDGGEHSYLEMGGDIDSQGLALTTMGLGHLLGIWDLLTPESIMPFLDTETKMMMAQRGMVSIKAKQGIGK